MKVKIADLGFARKLQVNELAVTQIGTPLNMAPEILFGHEYCHKADIWSLGCLFYEMLAGYPPFMAQSMPELVDKLQEGVYHVPKTVKLTLEGASFMNELL
jgi:serine/threonine protein kinase